MSAESQTGHETTDVRVGPLVAFLALLGVGCAAALALMAWLFGAFDQLALARDLPVHPLAPEHELPPGPRLQADPPEVMAGFRAAQELETSTPAWLDRDAGVVRLPLDVALERLLEEGLPTRAAGTKEQQR